MSQILKHSPAYTKERFRFIFTIMTWIYNSVDIKSAFLQGKDKDRDKCLTPPSEFEQKDNVWKLNRCFRCFKELVLRVKEELGKLGVKHNPLEPAFRLAFQEWIARFTYYTCKWYQKF